MQIKKIIYFFAVAAATALQADVTMQLTQLNQTLRMIAQAPDPQPQAGPSSSDSGSTASSSLPIIEYLTPEQVQSVFTALAGKGNLPFGTLKNEAVKYISDSNLLPVGFKRIKAGIAIATYIHEHPESVGSTAESAQSTPWNVLNIGSKRDALKEAIRLDPSLQKFEGKTIDSSLKRIILTELGIGSQSTSKSATVKQINKLYDQSSNETQIMILKDTVLYHFTPTPPKPLIANSYLIDNDDDDDSSSTWSDDD